MERQSHYTSKSWVGPALDSRPEESGPEPSIDERVKDYFSGLRDMNYYYVATTNNPCNQLFCMNKTKGIKFNWDAKKERSQSQESLPKEIRGLVSNSS